ncbi:MAG: SLOG family protein [Mucinivorans sp.]
MTIEFSRTVAFKGYTTDQIIRSSYNVDVFDSIRRRLNGSIKKLIIQGYTTFICGASIGFGTMAAEEVLAVRSVYPAIKLVFVVPYGGIAERFSPLDRELYSVLCSKADLCKVIAEGYVPDVFQQANNFLVDNASLMVGYYDKPDSELQYVATRFSRRGLPLLNLF